MPRSLLNQRLLSLEKAQETLDTSTIIIFFSAMLEKWRKWLGRQVIICRGGKSNIRVEKKRGGKSRNFEYLSPLNVENRSKFRIGMKIAILVS